MTRTLNGGAPFHRAREWAPSRGIQKVVVHDEIKVVNLRTVHVEEPAQGRLRKAQLNTDLLSRLWQRCCTQGSHPRAISLQTLQCNALLVCRHFFGLRSKVEGVAALCHSCNTREKLQHGSKSRRNCTAALGRLHCQQTPTHGLFHQQPPMFSLADVLLLVLRTMAVQYNNTTASADIRKGVFYNTMNVASNKNLPHEFQFIKLFAHTMIGQCI